MSLLLKRGNDALATNPNIFHYPTKADATINTHGSDWYWTVTAVMTVSTLAFIGLSYTVPRSNRVFHYITASITLVAAVAYFTMASNLGYAAIDVEFVRNSAQTRAVFYVRYIDWFVTTPLILLNLLLTAGLPWPTILYTLLLDEVMVVSALVGALVVSSYKWGYFVFALFALFGVSFNVMVVAKAHAFALGSDIHRVFLMCSVWIIFLWFLYPIAWGVSEGGNVIGADGEAIFYGVLDILSKPVFGVLLLFGHRNIDPARLGLAIRDYTTKSGVHEKTPIGTTGTLNNGVVDNNTAAPVNNTTAV